MKLEAFTISNANTPDEICQMPEGVCLLVYRGSIAHGMYIPSTDPNHIDDVDLMGVALGKPANYLGLHEWGSRGTYDSKQGKWDVVCYEMRKMVSLLLQGNPNVLSALWVEPQHRLYYNFAGKEFLDHRDMFVGKHVYNAFAGYAHAQLEKMELRDPDGLREYLAVTAEAKHRGIHPNHKGEEFPVPDRSTGVARDAANYGNDSLIARLRHYQKKGDNIGYLGDKRKQLVLEHGYDAKNASHCIRLLRMCLEFLSSGALRVLRPDASELLDIKRGKWSLDQIKSHAQALFSDIKIARDKSKLPEVPDYEGAEKMLVEILTEHLRG